MTDFPPDLLAATGCEQSSSLPGLCANRYHAEEDDNEGAWPCRAGRAYAAALRHVAGLLDEYHADPPPRVTLTAREYQEQAAGRETARWIRDLADEQEKAQ